MAHLNYFSHASAAHRYAAFRPYFHPLIVERIVKFAGCARFTRALDVACGTGNSTRALAEIADKVVAVDNSPAMLALAPTLPNAIYQKAEAEALPFADAAFDLVTVGLAFHWFDQAKFLDEAQRVLQPGSWLVIYNNYFISEMRERADFADWVRGEFLQRYMTPPRSRKKLSADFAAAHGFTLAGPEGFPNDTPMTHEQLTGYFLSQSNVISKVEHGGEKIEEVAAWVAAGTQPFFDGGGPRTMRFQCDIWYLRKPA